MVQSTVRLMRIIVMLFCLSLTRGPIVYVQIIYGLLFLWLRGQVGRLERTATVIGQALAARVHLVLLVALVRVYINRFLFVFVLFCIVLFRFVDFCLAVRIIIVVGAYFVTERLIYQHLPIGPEAFLRPRRFEFFNLVAVIIGVRCRKFRLMLLRRVVAFFVSTG